MQDLYISGAGYNNYVVRFNKPVEMLIDLQLLFNTVILTATRNAQNFKVQQLFTDYAKPHYSS